jgi:integrase
MTLTPASPNHIISVHQYSGEVYMGFSGGSIQRHGNRFYVQLYWNKITEKFWSVLIQGQWHPIKSRENGEKLLRAIQEDIDRDREGFDPRSFRPQNPLSLGEYHQTWLEQIDVTTKTRRDYRTALVKYVIPFFGLDKDIRKFKKAELVSFQKSIGGSEKWRYNVMGSLKSMIRWAYQNEEIKSIPPFPKMSMGEAPEIEYLTLEQQENVLAHIPLQDSLIFRFAMEYGLRVGEVRALKRDAIKDGKVYIHRAFSENELKERTKTGDIRNPALTPYAKGIIDCLKHLGPFLFVRGDGKPYTNKNLNRIWREASEKAGIKIKLYNAIRHSLGCQLLDEGQDLSLVQEILGHRNQQMTRRYAKRTAKKIGQVLSMRRQNCGRAAVEIIDTTTCNH